MTIDWSKAPEGWDIHIMWSGGKGRFYKDCGDRYVREYNMYAKVDEVKSSGGIITRRPTAWTGEGLPPVGTVCEYNDLTNSLWLRVKVLAHFDNKVPVAVFIPDNESQNKTVDQAIAECFRPIRTAEQIAAEERQIAIENLGEWLSTNCSIPTLYLWEAAQKIYDAGYRKQEQK
jgi:hypothetical protein